MPLHSLKQSADILFLQETMLLNNIHNISNLKIDITYEAMADYHPLPRSYTACNDTVSNIASPCSTSKRL